MLFSNNPNKNLSMFVNKILFYKELPLKIFGIARNAQYSNGHLTEQPLYETNIYLYNSAARRKVQFKTIRKKTVLWYSCGPTVYDSAHIGNMCSYMRFDIIRRIMENHFDLNVIMVMNITDIDDKIIAKANQLNTNCNYVAERYEKEFITNLKRFNIKSPSIKARVTENMTSIIEFIQNILDKGYAYISSDGSVYFSVDKYKSYGIFQPPQAEFNNKHSKECSRDFALWKSAKPGEPSWESPWGNGRPGWHIECSTIASKYLGKQIDLHSGGVDLKFPHHENEEAQCCAHHGLPQWVNYWIHSGHLYSKNNEKMSKSMKNTISVDEFLSSYTGNILRTFCLLVPYENNVEFRDETIEKAVSINNKINTFLMDLNAYLQGRGATAGNVDEVALYQKIDETKNIVGESLSNNFNTPRVMSEILSLISTTNSMLQTTNEVQGASSPHCLAAVYNFVQTNILALGYTSSISENVVDESFQDIIQSTVNFRSKIREAALQINKKDSEELLQKKQMLLNACDSVRKDLLQSGIELKDHGKSSTWHYVKCKLENA